MADTDTKPALFSVASLAKDWGVSPGFIRKEIRAGRLTPFRLGPKLIRISALEAETYLKKNGLAKGIVPDAAQ